MNKTFIKRTLILLVCISVIILSACNRPSDEPDIDLQELTVAHIHEAYRNNSFSAEQLVNAYLHRIKTYDRTTGLNSIILINPQAVTEARALDMEFRKTGQLRALHGIPMIVKDNYNTAGLQTTAGSVALRGFIPKSDAFQVRKLREAGAILLAKSNMAEWAFSPRHTESSIAGTTRNPYNLDHVPAGSSGGTAASIAANFATIGLGTDTGNSIRGPSSHNSLVGFRSTLGLTSRAGIVPLYLRNDVGGPMCRTVEDATRVLQVISGHDPSDPLTVYCKDKMPQDYLSALNDNALQGARIGVLRSLSEDDPNPEIKHLFEQALTDMAKLGAEIVDPLVITGFDSLRRKQWCTDFKQDIAAYLAQYVADDSLRTLQDIIDYGGYSEFVGDGLRYMNENSGRGGQSEVPCGDPFNDCRRIKFREAIENAMDAAKVSVIVYPSWNHPPSLLNDFMQGYKGDNSQVIAPHTGQPAFTVPMGFTSGNLPAGIQFLGRMFDETTLIAICYSYEQGTQHRKPAALTLTAE